MQLILTKNVAGLGAPGDVVDVKEGYARNFLVPRRLAITATDSAQKQAETIRAAETQRNVREKARAEEFKTKLAALGTVTVPARAGATGKLFGSVTAAQVAKAVAAAGGPQLDPTSVHIPAHHIRALGQHEVEAGLGAGLTAKLTLNIVAE